MPRKLKATATAQPSEIDSPFADDGDLPPPPPPPDPPPQPVPAMDDSSKKMLHAMEVAAHETSIEGARHEVFKVQNAGPVSPRLPKAIERFVESVFLTDDLFDQAVTRLEEADAEYRKLATAGAYAKCLLLAEEAFQDAHQLLVAFQRAVSRFEVEFVHAWGHVRDEATKSLQREKDTKERSKQITDADVESRASILFPDDWARSRARKTDNELAETRLKHAIDEWSSRCRSFQVLVGKR